MRRIDSPETKAAKILGDRLFTVVFGGDVAACLRSSIDQSAQRGVGLRIRLRLTDVPELAYLPWEYLYNQSLNRFIALSPETPIVRYLELPEPVWPLVTTLPLRVLVMISSPSDYPSLDADREYAKLKDALHALERRGQVVLERLLDGTSATLLRRLQKGHYHAFHFIGHGGFDRDSQDGFLIFQDEMKRGRALSGQDLGILLQGHRWMRLAVLNACEGARSSREDPFAGVAQSLVQQGTPAVVAMQFEITDEAAITFSHEFYGSLAYGNPADAALAEARRAIFAQGNGLEWGTPVLYMRSPDGRIFDVAISNQVKSQTLHVADERQGPKVIRTFSQVSSFARLTMFAGFLAALAWIAEEATGFAALFYEAPWAWPIGGGLAGLITGWAIRRRGHFFRRTQLLVLALSWSCSWVFATRFRDLVSAASALGGVFVFWQLSREQR
ncbi:MAG TPA: CHAT domain-containing protein [Terracidiphilus sp.]|nr:CHAT domain-containing protein [Terracidiphilus sp.]